ncbi:helix-turn-helix domain-containing protein [Vibrio lentus]|uniref:helix-turn-helix domain-containing protein n=1 Tax=Vibrio lentus TaxID=136468 RepID=UPI000C829C7A|nr:helix-turn-helix domain-containing protein [Vibrio lentus]
MIDQPKIRELIQAQLVEVGSTKATHDLSYVMKVVEDLLIDETVIHTRGNITKAARILGMNRGTLRAKYDRLLQSRKDFRLNSYRKEM